MVSGFNGDGIHLHPATAAQTFISETTVRGSTEGIYADAAATLFVSIVRCLLQNNSDGVAVDRATVAVRDSNAEGNAQNGFFARGSGGTAYMTIEASDASNNSGSGIEVDNGDVAVLGSTASANYDGFASLPPPGQFATLTLQGCVGEENAEGVAVGGSSRVSLTDSTLSDNSDRGLFLISGTATLVRNTITRNMIGISKASGTLVRTSSDNIVDGNMTDVSGPGLVMAASKF